MFTVSNCCSHERSMEKISNARHQFCIYQELAGPALASKVFCCCCCVLGIAIMVAGGPFISRCTAPCALSFLHFILVSCFVVLFKLVQSFLPLWGKSSFQLWGRASCYSFYTVSRNVSCRDSKLSKRGLTKRSSYL